MIDFSEFQSQGSSTSRKHGRVDEEQPPEEPYSSLYEQRVRKEYPLKSRADIYKHFALDPRFHRGEHPSSNVPPHVLPTLPSLDFTILSADLICKYWSLQENRLLSVRDWSYKLEQVNVPSTWLSVAIGGITGYAAYATFSAAAGAGANALLMQPVPKLLAKPVATFTTWASSSTHPIASSLSSMVAAPTVGTSAKKITRNKIDSWYIERKKKQARQNALKRYENSSKQALQDIDPDLFNLRLQCTNIYGLLCESRGLKCAHPEPYNCRRMYLDSWGEDQVGVIHDYLNLPRDLYRLYEQLREQDSSIFNDEIKPLFEKWYFTIRKHLPSAAGEVGLILSLLYPHLLGKHRMVFSVRVKTMLSWLFKESVDLYRIVIHSCFVSMLLSKDNSFIQFVQGCVFPDPADRTKVTKSNILEEIWQNLEEKLDDISVDVKIRVQKRYDYRGTKLQEQKEMPAFQITTELLERAGAIDAEIKQRMAGYTKNPTKVYVDYLRIQMKDPEFDENDTRAWIVAFRNMVTKLDGSGRDIYKMVAHPLISYILSTYNDYTNGLATSDQVVYVVKLYRMIKNMLINCRDELSNSKWTEEEDVKILKRLESTVKLKQPANEETNRVYAFVQHFADMDQDSPNLIEVNLPGAWREPGLPPQATDWMEYL